jgi:hypothetical protein
VEVTHLRGSAETAIRDKGGTFKKIPIWGQDPISVCRGAPVSPEFNGNFAVFAVTS